MAGSDGLQRARTGQLGVPGSQGTRAGSGPSAPPVSPEPPRAAGTSSCPPWWARILSAASYPSRSGLAPRPETLAAGNWQN